MQKFTDVYLEKAEAAYKQRCEKVLADCGDDWVKLQKAFLDMIDEYMDVEVKKDINLNIHTHEAGGQFRIAFPHLLVRKNDKSIKYLEDTVYARRKWTDANQFHGYVDCHEVHHEIETYIYYQMPLYYLGFPGAEQAAKNIIDVAEHVGNWVDGVPDWYNWETHSFVSNWLGTKGVRAYPPYDYQEGNHFRFTDCAMCACHITKDPRYLDLICDYCAAWCDHIEKLAAKGEVISCSILPEAAKILERNKAGVNLGETSVYEIFYSLAADNTMYDIAGGLLDAYFVSDNMRFRAAAELLIDQFVANGNSGRPALQFTKGKWVTVGDEGFDGKFICDCTFIARLALRHHQMTGSEKYKAIIMSWAASIDEENNSYDQMMANVLVAAHYFDGDSKWLARAYKMALRVWATSEHIDDYHQCAWSGKRQGTKFLMEMLYQPMLGDVDWGTRGNIPKLLFRHVTNGEMTLPTGVAFRSYMISQNEFAFEAVNTSGAKADWSIASVCGSTAFAEISLEPGESKKGSFSIK